jgi:hypothetical protein
MRCRVGWVDIGTRTKVPLWFVTYLSKVTPSSLVKTFWVIHYRFHNMGFMGINRCGI